MLSLSYFKMKAFIILIHRLTPHWPPLHHSGLLVMSFHMQYQKISTSYTVWHLKEEGVTIYISVRQANTTIRAF
jgi:hypothetical protein